MGEYLQENHICHSWRWRLGGHQGMRQQLKPRHQWDCPGRVCQGRAKLSRMGLWGRQPAKETERMAREREGKSGMCGVIESREKNVSKMKSNSADRRPNDVPWLKYAGCDFGESSFYRVLKMCKSLQQVAERWGDEKMWTARTDSSFQKFVKEVRGHVMWCRREN